MNRGQVNLKVFILLQYRCNMWYIFRILMARAKSINAGKSFLSIFILFIILLVLSTSHPFTPHVYHCLRLTFQFSSLSSFLQNPFKLLGDKLAAFKSYLPVTLSNSIFFVVYSKTVVLSLYLVFVVTGSHFPVVSHVIGLFEMWLWNLGMPKSDEMMFKWPGYVSDRDVKVGPCRIDKRPKKR